MADIKAKKVIFKNRDGEHLIPYVGDSVIDHRITNCITELPQRIKLELNDGVLTLKAGSVVIVPNGFEADGTTPKFDYVKLQQDLSSAQEIYSYTGNILVMVNANATALLTERVEITSSGTTPGNHDTFGTWYDTTKNIIKRTTDNGVTWNGNFALPIAFGSYNNLITSIDQIFNGFGYIGSTFWVDKGVRALAPNGRNEDGSLKNYEITTTQVSIYTRNLSGDVPLWLNANGTLFLSAGIAYDEKRNVIYSKNAEYQTSVRCQVAMTNLTNGVVKSFNPKQPFRAVDYSDKAEISSWSMPSSKYIDLTLGASGSRYTAPANGWLYLQMAYQADKYIDLWNSTSQTGSVMTSASANSALRTMIPCRKGDDIAIRYTATTVKDFRFIYTEGEV